MFQANAESSSSSQRPQPSRHFKFPEIQLATRNFDESLVIGHGGFGKVYKGTIVRGSSLIFVAIKRLGSMSSQGANEFSAELKMLSKLRHCHLVSLIGYCDDDKEMILVYEYMAYGSLEDRLHKLYTPLSWLQRLKLCIGAARGLDYLHTGTGIKLGIIHHDVKSANILLDKNWAAKISDLGLSKKGPNIGHVSTLVKGTFGYLDPDYYSTGRLTMKSDVYAFGVVLFEVLCRKRASDVSDDEKHHGLARWALDSIKKGTLKHIIDYDIRDQIFPKCSKGFVHIAKRCLHSHPKQRPTMAEVVFNLESILALQEKNDNSLQSWSKPKLGRMADIFLFSNNGKKSGNSNSSLIHLERPIEEIFQEIFQEHAEWLIVHFRSLDRPKEDDFSLELSKLHTYDDVVERVAHKIGLDDPSKIRLTPHNCYSQEPKPHPIKYLGAIHLLEMLVYYNQISYILYYEVLDIPLPELQCLITLTVVFHHAKKEARVIYNIRLPKESTVGDVLNDLKTKTKMEVSHPNAEIRLLQISRHRIFTILPLTERIENLNHQCWTLRAEEIPEEEEDPGPTDRLIHVYHFTKETAEKEPELRWPKIRGVMTPPETKCDLTLEDDLRMFSERVKNFGEPFFLIIQENETLSDVKVRIKRKLQVLDDEFSEWKFAFVSVGHPKYLQDSDIVSSYFQDKDFCFAWERYLGLEHLDTTPKIAI